MAVSIHTRTTNDGETRYRVLWSNGREKQGFGGSFPTREEAEVRAELVRRHIAAFGEFSVQALRRKTTSAARTISKHIRFEVMYRAGFACHYCGRTPPDVKLHVDHVIPISAGGTDDLFNLVTACLDCNVGKGGRLLDYDRLMHFPATPGDIEDGSTK